MQISEKIARRQKTSQLQSYLINAKSTDSSHLSNPLFNQPLAGSSSTQIIKKHLELLLDSKTHTANQPFDGNKRDIQAVIRLEGTIIAYFKFCGTASIRYKNSLAIKVPSHEPHLQLVSPLPKNRPCNTSAQSIKSLLNGPLSEHTNSLTKAFSNINQYLDTLYQQHNLKIEVEYFQQGESPTTAEVFTEMWQQNYYQFFLQRQQNRQQALDDFKSRMQLLTLATGLSKNLDRHET